MHYVREAQKANRQFGNILSGQLNDFFKNVYNFNYNHVSNIDFVTFNRARCYFCLLRDVVKQKSQNSIRI